MTAAVDVASFWQTMRDQSLLVKDRLSRKIMITAIRDHTSFQLALGALLASKLADRSLEQEALSTLFVAALAEETGIAAAAAEDIVATYERDAACMDYLTPFLFLKGYQAIQASRIAHWLWQHERQFLALHVQSRVSERFGLDIHPAAQIGRRVVVDHGTGVVIGETCVIGDDVSIMQGVTLGGTGKETGDRHPKVRRGVLIGAGAIVLGNIELGEGAKIGAGSVVLEDVPPYVTVVGNPAKKMGKPHATLPGLAMDHRLPPPDYTI